MASTERGLARKVFDKAGLVTSAVTVPSEIIGLGAAIAAGSLGGVLLFSSLLKMEHAQFTQHGKPPEQQSWYNPERLWDRVFAGIGRLRINKTSRIAYSEPIAAAKAESNLVKFPTPIQRKNVA